MWTRQSRKGYDRYTVPDDSSCRTYFCCFPLAFANIFPWPFVPILSISPKNSELKTTHNAFRDCIPYPILNIMRIVVFFCCCFSLKLQIGITIAFRSADKNVIWGWVYVWYSRTKTMITLPVATKQKKKTIK